jgi:kynureninase
VSFFRPAGRRRKLLIEAKAFPSDYFAAVSQLRFHGLDPAECLIEAQPRAGSALVTDDDICALLETHGDEIALVWLGCVQYYSGQAFDMRRITEAGHARGCTVGFDLAHGAGNLPLELHDWGVDVATFCSYKLSGGEKGLYCFFCFVLFFCFFLVCLCWR